jgi:zinc/manganese transport system permease protein
MSGRRRALIAWARLAGASRVALRGRRPAARFWGREVWTLSLTSGAIALACGYVGLLLSYHADLPSGPAIVLTAAVFYFTSLLVGTCDSVRTRYFVRSHIHV